MTDSVTLYRQHHRGWYEDTWKEYKKVGEFVSRPWCQPHQMTTMIFDGKPSQQCEVGAYWGDHCTTVDVLVQVIPDDH